MFELVVSPSSGNSCQDGKISSEGLILPTFLVYQPCVVGEDPMASFYFYFGLG